MAFTVSAVMFPFFSSIKASLILTRVKYKRLKKVRGISVTRDQDDANQREYVSLKLILVTAGKGNIASNCAYLWVQNRLISTYNMYNYIEFLFIHEILMYNTWALKKNKNKP